ncbi:MAG: hypothetical protein Q8N59_03500 [bacterium]|nr:hypothetical protein [bacterium]
MEKELSRKERKQIRRADEGRIIWNITSLTTKNEASWERLRCCRSHYDFCRAVVEIKGVKVIIDLNEWPDSTQLTIHYGDAHKIVYRNGKNKPDFKILDSAVMEQQIHKIQEQESRKQPDQDTTMVLPLSPEKKLAEPTDQENLKKVVDFLTT